MTFTGDPPLAMAEVMVVTTHHPEVTHLDAMSHMVTDGKVYPAGSVSGGFIESSST
jgi:hypothetical protein